MFLFSFLAKSQPVYLGAEKDINTGLSGNSIKVIKKDNNNRLWVGTDNGLVILHNTDPFLASIVAKIKKHPIWALDFYKNYVFIGTRFHGLYIYDLTNKRQPQYFDSTKIGNCRRLRVIDDTVFVASQNAPYYLVYKEKKWRLSKIKTAIKNGFFTDFVKWKNSVFATFYGVESNRHICYFKNDSLVNSVFTKSIVKNDSTVSFLSASANDSLVLFGGAISYISGNREDITTSNLLLEKNSNKLYPVWDIDFVDNRPFMATGNPDNNKVGMIYELGVNTLSDLNKSFYAQSLYFDKRKQGLWMGTLNRGLFYWPYVSSSYHIPDGIKTDYKIKPLEGSKVLLYNDEKVVVSDIKSNVFTELFHKNGSIKFRAIYDVDKWNDTTAVLTSESLILINKDKKILNVIKYNPDSESFNTIYRNNNLIYLFSTYFDKLIRVNLKTNGRKTLLSTSNKIVPVKFKNGIIYSSFNTGFHYFDTVSHAFNIPFPVIESYTILNDTLWVLNSGILNSYQINLSKFSLIPIHSINISKKISSFLPNWVVACKGKIFTGNKNGFINIDSKEGLLSSYHYMGNYSQEVVGVSNGEFMYFNHTNYITKLNPDSLKIFRKNGDIELKIQPDVNVYHNTPFIIYTEIDDYVVRKHSLKKLNIFSDGKLIQSIYSLDDQFSFPAGLKNGKYLITLSINGIIVTIISIQIHIPLTSNPLFYVSICIFLVIFLIVLFKSILNKRSYDKHILENRLELFKQNLNPHFVFNSLNLIYSLVLENKNTDAIKTINNFSDLHRYYLENINKPKITLVEELSFAESYLKLQSQRVEKDTPIVYIFPKDLNYKTSSTIVPTMILQPLIENAVKYCGIDHSTSEDGTIWIDVICKGNTVEVGIENTLSEATTKTIAGNGLGLRLVNERIEIYNKTYSDSISLEVAKNSIHCNRGYRVVIYFRC